MGPARVPTLQERRGHTCCPLANLTRALGHDTVLQDLYVCGHATHDTWFLLLSEVYPACEEQAREETST